MKNELIIRTLGILFTCVDGELFINALQFVLITSLPFTECAFIQVMLLKV